MIRDFLCYSQIFKTGLGISAPAANKTLMMSNTSIILCKRIFQGGDEFSPRGELVIGYNLGFVGLRTGNIDPVEIGLQAPQHGRIYGLTKHKCNGGNKQLTSSFLGSL